MIKLNSYLSIVTLIMNGLNDPIKRCRVSDWIKKQDLLVCCLQETHLRPKDIYRLKMKGQRTIRLTEDLSTETWQARKGWQDILRVLNEKNMQPRILYPARLSFRIEGDKELPIQTETERICDHQTSSARNIKGASVKERGCPKK